MIEQYDDKTIRCPRIGGDVNFMFCRSENNMLPCRFLVGCWQRRLNVKEFLDEHYAKEDLARVFVPPKPKIESLMEMINEVKKGEKGTE
ncbi:hypothetical protein ACFL7M_11405 [Thermodesulfobacteriota bacterium]